MTTQITVSLDQQTLDKITNLTTALENLTAKLNTPASVECRPEINPTAGTVSSTPTAQPLVVQAPVTNVTPVQPVAPSPTPTPTIQPAAEPQQPTAIPTSHVAQAYTVEQLQTAMAALVDMGKMDDIRVLLSNFGVQSVMALQPDQYGALATALRGMGAQI